MFILKINTNCIFFFFKLVCVNTVSWHNRHQEDCTRYVQIYCENGHAKDGYSYMMTNEYNNPQENCCVCGKGPEGI